MEFTRKGLPEQHYLYVEKQVSMSNPESIGQAMGEAFMAVGKTRPVEPAKVVWPSPSAQSCTVSGLNSASIGRSADSAPP